MTELIYFELPLLAILPIIAIVCSIAVSILSKMQILQWISAAIHGVLIAAVIYFGGGFSDIFVMLLVSLISSCICGYLKNKKGGSTK